MKPKIAAYVTADVARRLELAAQRPGATKSDIVTEALDRFLDPARDKQLAAMVLNGQRELSPDLRCMAREHAVVAETLALFVRYVLTVTPPLPRSDQEFGSASPPTAPWSPKSREHIPRPMLIGVFGLWTARQGSRRRPTRLRLFQSMTPCRPDRRRLRTVRMLEHSQRFEHVAAFVTAFPPISDSVAGGLRGGDTPPPAAAALASSSAQAQSSTAHDAIPDAGALQKVSRAGKALARPVTRIGSRRPPRLGACFATQNRLVASGAAWRTWPGPTNDPDCIPFPSRSSPSSSWAKATARHVKVGVRRARSRAATPAVPVRTADSTRVPGSRARSPKSPSRRTASSSLSRRPFALVRSLIDASPSAPRRHPSHSAWKLKGTSLL